MTPQICPKCGTALVEGKPDGNGKPWFYCDDCETFWHTDDLDHAAEHADWLDELRTIASLRMDLYERC